MLADISFDVSQTGLELLEDDIELLNILKTGFAYEFDEKTTVREFCSFVYKRLTQEELLEMDDNEILDRVRFFNGKELATANGMNVILQKFLNYIGMPSDHITLVWIVGIGGGFDFAEEDSIRYRFKADEVIHFYNPHVHVYYKDYEVSLSIWTGETFAGLLPKRQLNKAIKYIMSRQRDILKGWNEHTNGKKVAIT